MLLTIPERRFQASAPSSRGHWRDLLDGFSYVLRSGAADRARRLERRDARERGVNVAECSSRRHFDAGHFGLGLLVGGAGVGLASAAFYAWRCSSGAASPASTASRSC